MDVIITLVLLLAYVAMTGSVAVVDTYPRQKWYLNTLDWTLRPIMKLFFHGKLTPGHHWKAYYGVLNYDESVRVAGDPSALEVRGWFSQILAELYGWHVVAVLTTEYAHPLGKKPPEQWKIGFKNILTGEKKLCTIVLSTHSDRAVRLYVGRENIMFFATNLQGKQLTITLLARTRRDDSQYVSYKLL